MTKIIAYCSVCNSNRTVLLKYRKRASVQNFCPYEIYQCSECSFQFVCPIPSVEELKRYYENSAKRSYQNYVEATQLKIAWFNTLFDIAERYTAQPGDFLDIGCASGFGLSVAKKRGWNPLGIDISQENLKHVTEDLKNNTYCSSIEDFETNRKFNLIFMTDIIEHLCQPRLILTKVYNMLNNGGVLFVQIPCVDSLSAVIFRDKWYHYAPPAHLNFFSNKTFDKLSRDVGFDIKEKVWMKKLFEVNYFFKQLEIKYSKFPKIRVPIFGDWNFSLGSGERVFVLEKLE